MLEGPYEIHFYETERGDKPAVGWIDDLSQAKNAAMVTAMRFYLQKLGPDVCKSKMGERVGAGIVEFKVWQEEDELLREAGLEGVRSSGSSEGILLRLFVYFHGDHQILVLDGYNKGRRNQRRVQQEIINRAKRRLEDYKRRHHS